MRNDGVCKNSKTRALFPGLASIGWALTARRSLTTSWGPLGEDYVVVGLMVGEEGPNQSSLRTQPSSVSTRVA